MEQAADVSHGVYATLLEASALPGRIAAGHPIPLSAREEVPLWNRWDVLALFAALLSAEWILRKRARLL